MFLLYLFKQCTYISCALKMLLYKDTTALFYHCKTEVVCLCLSLFPLCKWLGCSFLSIFFLLEEVT